MGCVFGSGSTEVGYCKSMTLVHTEDLDRTIVPFTLQEYICLSYSSDTKHASGGECLSVYQLC